MRCFISQIRGRAVRSPAGARLGSLVDVIVATDRAGSLPVRGLVVRAAKRDVFVPAAHVVGLDERGARLDLDPLPVGEFHRRANDVLLEHDVLDHQVVDVAGARVLRANDAELQYIDGGLRVAGIDVGTRAILRRLGPQRMVGGLQGDVLEWAQVDVLASAMPEADVQLRHEKLRGLDASDLARIVESLAYPQAAEVMQALDDAAAADVLEEVDEDRQVDILEMLPAERAADILGRMAPDAAADVLDGMPRDRADDLIARMDVAAAAPVRLLLSYPRDSAGGLMTTDFVIALAHETTREAIEYVRRQIGKPDLIYYVYVVDDSDNQRLVGVASLRDLLLAQPGDLLTDYMRRSPRAIRPDESAQEAARVMTAYNLLALPVVDEAGRMLGLVTADDALDVLLPDALKRHVPRLFS